MGLNAETNLQWTQESLSRYRLGGYHPVTLGDEFKDRRYTVHHKLGFGTSFTEWLAWDEVENRWIALKIMAADYSTSQEAQNFEHLRKRGDLNSNFIIQLYDSFIHIGPHGQHQCLIFELTGPRLAKSLADYSDWDSGLDVHTIIELCYQLLEATRFMHKAGLCHGDISPWNVAFSSPRLAGLSKEEIMTILGEPEIGNLSTNDGTPLPQGYPTQLVGVAAWADWVDEDEEDLRLIGLEECFPCCEQVTELAQNSDLRVPETFFVQSFDYRVDLWRIGVTIYCMIFLALPFFSIGNTEFHIDAMTGFVEELPAEWRPAWSALKKHFGRDYVEDAEGQGACMSRIEVKFNRQVLDPYLKQLQPIISGLMRFIPANRITLDTALDMLPELPEGYISETWALPSDDGDG